MQHIECVLSGVSCCPGNDCLGAVWGRGWRWSGWWQLSYLLYFQVEQTGIPHWHQE